MASGAEAVARDQGAALEVSCGAGLLDGLLPACISIRPPKGVDRVPMDVCCVVDISWSMSMEATVQSGSGVVESNGLSLMDIAKHAVRTVANCLGPQDRLSIVTFAATGKTVLPMTGMDAAGKALADEAVKDIGFDSDTQLWTGLQLGLDVLDTPKEGRLGHMMLLTDGEAKDKPVIMKNLQEYKAKKEKLPCDIYTFGIGYEIDSPLLTQVSAFSDGAYAFIPDAGFVGTIFVNTISNMMVTMGTGAVLTLEVDGGAKIDSVMGKWEHKSSSDGIMRLDLGSIQYDQSKDIVLLLTPPPGVDIKDIDTYLAASLEYTVRDEKTDRVRCQAEGKGAKASDKESTAQVEAQRCRCIFTDALANAVTAAVVGDGPTLDKASRFIEDAAKALGKSSNADMPAIQSLIEDATGQSREALSRADWYEKWGRHYLPSLMLAHKLQQCNNFKDPGVQGYGGALFQTLRDSADEVFITLSAPTVTPAMWRYLGGGQLIANPTYVRPGGVARAAAPAAPISMATYHDACGG